LAAFRALAGRHMNFTNDAVAKRKGINTLLNNSLNAQRLNAIGNLTGRRYNGAPP